jgi:hypothetical protein
VRLNSYLAKFCSEKPDRPEIGGIVLRVVARFYRVPFRIAALLPREGRANPNIVLITSPARSGSKGSRVISLR